MRLRLLCLLFLAAALPCMAATPASTPPRPFDAPVAPSATPVAEAAPAVPSTPGTVALPAMHFVASIAADDLHDALKANPAFAALDRELVGSPMTLVVTHTNRPTPGGQAAGLVSAVLSGSTLGLIPIVSNEQLVVRYEVLLNGKPITSHSFERTATRATNLWSAGSDEYAGVGKAGHEWLKSTAAEAAAKLAADPAIAELRREIEFYFPPGDRVPGT